MTLLVARWEKHHLRRITVCAARGVGAFYRSIPLLVTVRFWTILDLM